MIMSGVMSKRPAGARADATPALTVPQRILLFCVASGTEWERAGITGSAVTAMIVRSLIERDARSRLALTPREGAFGDPGNNPHEGNCESETAAGR
jgi:hypothetical protein